MTAHACITVDLDTLQCYRDIHGLNHDMPGHEGDPTYRVGLERMLELFDEYDVEATLFVIGRDTNVPLHQRKLKEADDAGHELGNHTYSHHYDLADRSREEQQSEIARGEGAIASVCGRRPVGFRTPGYNVTPRLVQMCASRGYHYDSSIFPCPPYWIAKRAIMAWQKLRGRPSRSAITPPKNLLAPITAYHPERERIWRADPTSEMPLEIPMCLVPGVRIPVIGTSLHLFGEAGFDWILPALERTYDRILNLEFHALDFIDASDAPDGEQLAAVQPDLRVGWPKKRALYSHVLERLSDSYQFSTMRDAVGVV